MRERINSERRKMCLVPWRGSAGRGPLAERSGKALSYRPAPRSRASVLECGAIAPLWRRASFPAKAARLLLWAALLLAPFTKLPAATPIVIPFEWKNGLIWVKVEAAGKRFNFVLDSGAGATVLNFDTVQRLRLKAGEPRPVYGAGANSVAYLIHDFNGNLNGVALKKEVFAVPLRRLKGRGWSYRKMDGLIGQDFFRGRVIEIDYQNRRLTLLERGAKPPGAIVLPLRYQRDAMCVPVAVNGSKAQWTRLDTGCVTALEWVGQGGEARTEQEAEVQLGARRHPGVPVGFHAKPLFPDEAGLLGNGLLSRYRVTIDARAMQVLMEAQ